MRACWTRSRRWRSCGPISGSNPAISNCARAGPCRRPRRSRMRKRNNATSTAGSRVTRKPCASASPPPCACWRTPASGKACRTRISPRGRPPACCPSLRPWPSANRGWNRSGAPTMAWESSWRTRKDAKARRKWRPSSRPRAWPSEWNWRPCPRLCRAWTTPLEPLSTAATLAEYALDALPAEGDYGAHYAVAEEALGRCYALYFRIFGRLALSAGRVEGVLGLGPLRVDRVDT